MTSAGQKPVSESSYGDWRKCKFTFNQNQKNNCLKCMPTNNRKWIITCNVCNGQYHGSCVGLKRAQHAMTNMQ